MVVDPGQDSREWITATCREQGLTPAAVIATHGHLDHVAEAAAVCADWDVACWIHPADRVLLSEPMQALPAEWRPLLLEMIGSDTLSEPRRVETYGDDLQGDDLELAGIEFSVTHAPGHSPGSVVLQWLGDGHTPYAFSGDVIFAGSIGRTDLPGSDPSAMADTLERLVATIPAETVLLPGHGPRTIMGAELTSNPYLPR